MFGLGALVTSVVVLVPAISFVYRSPTLHVAIETCAILIGLMAAILVFGRFRQRGAAQDVVLVYVLLVLAFTNLFFSAVPAALGGQADESFLAWTQTTARLVATAFLAVAAFTRTERSRALVVAGPSIAIASAVTLLLIAALALSLSGVLPDPLGSVVEVSAGTRPSVDGHPVFLAAQLGQMALFGLAAVGFLRKAETEHGAMTAWIAAGCVLAAFSRFNYFLFPSRFTDYVYVGDFLRLGFYLCLLVGGVREISSYWRSLAEARVTETRRRLASDLHDGVAQELVFITAQTQRLLKKGAQPHDLQRLASAADRAVAESRRAMNALSTEREQTLEEAIVELGEETDRRVGVKVNLDLEPVAVSPYTREGLIRITREALMNAVRHSEANLVKIELRNQDGEAWIAVSDEGVGFDPALEASRKKGFGLVSLTERAKALGGEATVTSAPGAGTKIVIRVPAEPS